MDKKESKNQDDQEEINPTDSKNADPSIGNEDLMDQEESTEPEKEKLEAYSDYEEVVDEDSTEPVTLPLEEDPMETFSKTEEEQESLVYHTEPEPEMKEPPTRQSESKKMEPIQPEPKSHNLKSGIFGGVIGGAVVALLGAGILFGTGTLSYTPNSVNDSEITTGNNQSQSTNVSLDVTTDSTIAIEQVQDAVVSVINMTESSGNPFGFTIPQSETERDSNLVTQGEGSGVIYKIEGDIAYVVTNNHVIDNADALEVLMKDGTKKEAELIGNDIWTDLAVLTIPVEGIETIAQFGDSDSLNVGEPAIAIGSPLGINFATSATQGIISATNRTVETDIDGDGVTDWDITAIQTDASINPGNSGGALINIAGKVIGINSMKIADAKVEGMGFAIPSNDVIQIIAELEEHGEVIRPILGVSMVDLKQVSASQQRSTLKIPEDVTSGVVIADVSRLSAAEVGGLKQYDVIVEMDGEEITNMVELRKILYSHEVGSTIEVKFYRDGEIQTLEITLTDGQPTL